VGFVETRAAHLNATALSHLAGEQTSQQKPIAPLGAVTKVEDEWFDLLVTVWLY